MQRLGNRTLRVAALLILLAVSLCACPVASAELLNGPWLVRGHAHQLILPPGHDLRRLAVEPRVSVPAREHDFPQVQGRVRGEFEHQHALLLGCHELIEDMPELFVEIVRQTSGKVSIIALVSDVEEYQFANMILRSKHVAADHVRFAEVMHDTLWARDYGPMIVDSKDRGPVVLDAGYGLGRSNDDRVPEELARLFKLPLVPVPLTIAGGNLLTNGEGFAIVTDQILAENVAADDDEDVFFETLRRTYGFQQVVMLESLVGEATGHVDMFATLTSPNTVLVGAYTYQQDAENAAILDRNAARLGQVSTSHGPLRVVRVPMPPHDDHIWRTYTNVIYANGVVLVPIYPELDHRGRRRALEIFSKALPTWKVVGVDATRIIELNGALHCIAMNLGAIGQLPAFPEPRRKRARWDSEESELTEDRDTRDRELVALRRRERGVRR
ncbi:MAG: agmatine deiminase family protein [Pirellulales bacterium]